VLDRIPIRGDSSPDNEIKSKLVIENMIKPIIQEKHKQRINRVQNQLGVDIKIHEPSGPPLSY
jgi:hypothetical protein